MSRGRFSIVALGLILMLLVSVIARWAGPTSAAGRIPKNPVPRAASGIITEFETPCNGCAGGFITPVGITSGPDGALWFTAQNTNQIGRLTPVGAITHFAVPSGGGLFGITSGSDGNLWFAER